MQLDISDVDAAKEEMIRLLKEYKRREQTSELDDLYTTIYNGSLNFRTAVRPQWEQELEKVAARSSLTLYPVCRQKQEERILSHGIYHDNSPTLTPSLVGAMAQAEAYQSFFDIGTTVLMADVASEELEFIMIDHLGPGFLPVAKRTKDQIPHDALPPSLIEHIFTDLQLPAARWLDPKYFKGAVHRTSKESVGYIIDRLR